MIIRRLLKKGNQLMIKEAAPNITLVVTALKKLVSQALLLLRSQMLHT